MADYTAITQQLIDANLIEANRVCHYGGSHLSRFYQELFDFGHEYIEENQDAYHIAPAHLYYENVFSINARAYREQQHQLIAIYEGAVEGVWTFYDDRNDIWEGNDFAPYRAVAAHRQLSVAEFSLQFNLLYIYYHEFGHLIQNNQQAANFSCQEQLVGNAGGDNVLLKHAKECDADWFAAGKLVDHLTAFYKNANGDLVGGEAEVSRLLTLGLSVIFNYFVLNAQYMPDIYFGERSHPHPILRGVYVMQFIMDTIPGNLPENFQINMAAVLGNAFRLSETLLNGEFANPAMHFAGMYLQNADQIEPYIQVIIGELNEHPQFCMQQHAAGLLPQ